MKKFHAITEILQKNAFLLLIVILSFLIFLLSSSFFVSKPYFSQTFVRGEVVSIDSEEIEINPYVPGQKVGRQDLSILILSGKEKGNTFKISNTLSIGHNVYAEVGKKYVITIRLEGESKKIVWLYNYNRVPVLLGILLLFIVLVLFIAGKQGLKSLVALGFTCVMLFGVLIPLILRGVDPIFLSIGVLSIITVVSFLLISGFTKKSLIAILGTVCGVVAAGVISYIGSAIAHLSGVQMDKGEEILYIAKDFGIRINGFLFISILIASSGAVMDVAMSLTSALDEIKRHSPNISASKLFHSGMSIGRDLIGTMVNTLILAFVGSSFTLILMVVGLSMSFTQYINIPLISIEIIQALAGSIGIILTVPLTNIIFIIVNKKEKQE